MIARKTSKNQLTLPKKVAERFPGVEYLDVRVAEGTITLGRLVSALFGVAPTDVVSYAAAASMPVVVALLASYLPVRRVLQSDPSRALRVTLGVVGLLSVLSSPIGTTAAGYDPMAVSSGFVPKTVDLVVKDASRQRDIPVRIHLPDSAAAAPVVLFSHGLGGSRESGRYLGVHWAARGYVGVFLQHPGSDESVWQDAAAGARDDALRGAASARNLRLRVQDVAAVIDQLERWSASSGHQLSGRLAMNRLGMSGHSFGALTTQAVSGQRLSGPGAVGGGAPPTDARIKAAVIFSPSSPRGGDARTAFGGVKIPWLLMTGTDDVAPIGDIDVASRLAVFAALPPGDKYELVLQGAAHFRLRRSGAAGRSRRPAQPESPPRHHGAQHRLLGYVPARRRGRARVAYGRRPRVGPRAEGPLAGEVGDWPRARASDSADESRHADGRLHSLLKYRAFAAAAIGTLALGIGANTAIFSVVYATLLAPLPYPDPDRLVMVWSRSQTIDRMPSTTGDFLDWTRDSPVFRDLHAWSWHAMSLGTGETPARLAVQTATPGFLTTLGHPILMGRDFLPQEALAGNDRVVILTHRIWQSRFGGDRDIVGRQVRLDAMLHTGGPRCSSAHGSSRKRNGLVRALS